MALQWTQRRISEAVVKLTLLNTHHSYPLTKENPLSCSPIDTGQLSKTLISARKEGAVYIITSAYSTSLKMTDCLKNTIIEIITITSITAIHKHSEGPVITQGLHLGHQEGTLNHTVHLSSRREKVLGDDCWRQCFYSDNRYSIMWTTKATENVKEVTCP